MVLAKPNLHWSLLRVSLWGKRRQFGTFRVENKRPKGCEEVLAHPKGCEGIKAITAGTKDGDGLKIQRENGLCHVDT